MFILSLGFIGKLQLLFMHSICFVITNTTDNFIDQLNSFIAKPEKDAAENTSSQPWLKWTRKPWLKWTGKSMKHMY